MVEGLFDIALDTPKYHRRGTLLLKGAGERLRATLKVGDDVELEFEGSCKDKDFSFEGNADLPTLGCVDYRASGNVWGNSVSITCTTDAGKVEIFGTRLSASAGDPVSSHDYLMQASTGVMPTDENAMYSGLYADGS